MQEQQIQQIIEMLLEYDIDTAWEAMERFRKQCDITSTIAEAWSK